MKLSDLSKEDVIDEQWLDTYDHEADILQNQIIRLSTNTYILAKIAGFPFDVLYVPHQTTFWNHAASALYSSCILTIWRIAIDEDNDFLTLRRFENRIFAHLCTDGKYSKQDLEKTLAEPLGACNLKAVISSIKDEITQIRHGHLAHLKTVGDLRAPWIPKLRAIRDAIINRFDILTFRQPGQFAHLPNQYATAKSNRSDTDTDIDKELIELAGRSPIIRLPEEHPRRWKQRKKRLTGAQIERFNHYRKQLGLDPVSA